jgi:hypothetical protein
MSSDRLKMQLLNSMAQVVVFDERGRILESCQTLADFGELAQHSVFDLFPMLISMTESLTEQNDPQELLYLPGVEIRKHGLDGFFDMELKIHPKKPGVFVWLIVDQSRLYTYFRDIQQERNELRLNLEYLLNGKLNKLKG